MTALGGQTAAHTHLVWLVASALGLVLVASLLVLYRRARATAELEDAERVLAEAFAEPRGDGGAG